MREAKKIKKYNLEMSKKELVLISGALAIIIMQDLNFAKDKTVISLMGKLTKLMEEFLEED